jgi:hypothetical protein
MENKRKPGRPKGSKNKAKKQIIVDKPDITPTPTPSTKTEIELLIEWAKTNRPLFMNAGKKHREDLEKMYKLYNYFTGKNETIGKCGMCNGNIQLWLRKKLF